jgi:C1A family cysteine protease
MGCNGGWMDSAFDYIKDNGIMKNEDYPYVVEEQDCKIQGGYIKVKGYNDVPGCTDLVNALFERPISVAVDASAWTLYSTGVLFNCAKKINHAALLVGVSDTYWKIKNSWGAAWGENGFIRLTTGDTCGVCQYPSYPVYPNV